MKLIYIVLTFLCSSIVCKAQDDEIVAIKQTINNLFEGMRKSDTSLLRSAFSEGAIMQTVNKNQDGIVTIQTEPLDSFIHLIARPHSVIYDERITFDVIKVDNELAIAWTPYKFYLGEKFSHCGVDSYQLVKIKGVWKIQYLIDTRRKEKCL
ncbi:nuclear transport factor 2 family protein [Flavisolibacter ginsengisoli]|jgi:hypothetical protein|uniref:Putative lumazine-binding n=1 Tax=Flavisolibacter ginsengisoli DSM 18119 TaxID=1121884 RepID=A0A1M4YU00_9BACT|nr:nuclear transport factor 2 family protein [Flavisolibacter ginsengisoli]SHF09027.1 Putative lumazine-binding [Flavisolibacter ginsengisoli DSM 18119]